MIVDTLIEKIIEKQNPTCVGLDTALEYLPPDMQNELNAISKNANKSALADARFYHLASQLVYKFNCGIIDKIADIVPAVKVQIAYYEELGHAGVMAFEKTIKYAKKMGMIVITDAKRNDIGATATRYANAFIGRNYETDIIFPRADFPSDFLTVNGYLGSDGITPFVEQCKKHDKGIFVLVKTSNPSSGELQNLKLEDGRTVYECMGDMVERWGEGTVGKYGYSCVGAVVGATYPEEAKVLRARLPHTFFLVPGYGAQGANAEMLKNCFDANGLGGVVNNSRGVLCAYQKRGGTYDEAARAACLEMRADLQNVLGGNMREVTATILENVRIAENIFSLTFATEEEINVRPGQFCMVGVQNFPLRRPIAVCKAEGERITVCYQVKGAGTHTLAENYKQGEQLSVLLPLGNGFYVKDEEKRVALVGGGVGIFPLISAIRAYAGKKEVYSYMGFKNRAAYCLPYELQRSDRLVVATDDGSMGFHGTSVQAFMAEIDEVKPDVVLSCGPVPMLRALKKATADRNIPVFVSLEERMGCGIGACLVCVCEKTDGAHARVCKDGPVFDINEVTL